LTSQKICYLFITYSLLPNCIVLYQCNNLFGGGGGGGGGGGKKNSPENLARKYNLSHDDVTKRV
jgi:hypothetical protein